MIEPSTPFENIVSGFLRQAASRPEAIAAENGRRRLSYGELDELSERMAEGLRAAGVQPGDRVALDLPMSIDAVAAALAALKCGASYRMAPGAGAAADVVVADTAVALPANPDATVLSIDALARPITETRAAPAAPAEIDANAIAVTTETAGVLATYDHFAISRFAEARSILQLGSGDRVVLSAAPGTDVAALEIWGALATGATLVLPTQAGPAGLAALLRKARITVLVIEAAEAAQILDIDRHAFADLRAILVLARAGEELPIPALADAAPEPMLLLGRRVEGIAGPCFTARITPEMIAAGGPFPLGAALPGSEILLVDADGRPNRTGPGRVFVAGAGLSAEHSVPASWNERIRIVDAGLVALMEDDGQYREAAAPAGIDPASGRIEDRGAAGCQVIPEVFRTVAADHSGRVALRFDGAEMDYATLDARSDALAGHLAALGVAPGDFVGIASGRSMELIVAVLGVLKAGAAYVPLDTALPADRLTFIAGDTGLRVLLGDCAPVAALDGVTAVPTAAFPVEGTAPKVELTGESPAYVMYTSGTTGTPKGVVMPHRSAIRLLKDIDWAEFGPETAMLHASAFAFDASILDIFAPLLNGGSIVIPKDGMLSVADLADALESGGANTAWLTSGLFNVVADTRPGCFRNARLIMVGGDVVSPAHLAKVRSICSDVAFVNGYGPTETGTFTSTHPISDADIASGRPIPIGRAVNGTQVYILGDDLMPVAQGEQGELCVAGRGLALGYHDRPEQTAEKFVAAPWDETITLYRTGDLATADADGTLNFLGRADQQVKIRGNRVELGEIEAALTADPAIRNAAVIAVAQGDSADKRLVAFYVSDEAVDESALRKALAEKLPEAARPAELRHIDELPINPNGKTDRRALEAIRAEALKSAKPARNGAEENRIASLIAARFAEALGTEAADLDRQANFFDLGASSLHVARVHEELQRELGQTFPISHFFLHSTIDTLARHLSGGTEARGVVAAETRKAQKSDLIAIVGMAGRFPGAGDVNALWQGMLDGREMISHFSEEELDIDPRADDPDSPYVLARGVMQDADMFDAKHFGIPPREADRMDPQHRILLEVAQTALEDAGHDPARFPGRIGIFAGSSQNSYLLNNLVSAPGAARMLAAGYPVKDFATLFGNDKDFIATRVAYKLNLRGPAVTVQCACSTSLVAVGQACEALRSGQADMVLAGGVSVTFPSKRPYMYLPDGMASSDGHCRTFDAEATGTVFGDGAGLVVLRRLEDALADGDEVIAVIRGHAINNDGSDKAGYAAPSIRAQSEVIAAAHRAAGVTAREVGYVEAHGTATPLGDPIEFTALQTAFADAGETGYCALGSAKTNVGHLDIAAGVTGLIKAALTLKHGVIPPMLHYTAPNPRIDFEHSPFFPVAERRDWTRSERKRIAGVSAFGVGGTNIHMVLEEAPEAEVVVPASEGPFLFPVSGSAPEAVTDGIARLAAFARANPQADPARVVSTLRHGRREFGHRAVILADDMADLAEAAEAHRGKPSKADRRDALAFLFPGQGAQHVGMARDLFEKAPVFREALSLCTEILKDEIGVDLLSIIHAPDSQRDEMTERLKDTSLAQPAIFATSYALAKQWGHWGVAPDAMIGHSIGEFAAATIAGVMDLRDALKLIALRGRLMADLPRGVMVSVRASEEEVLPYLNSGLDLAAVNGAKAVVLAGPQETADAILPRIEADGLVVSRLHTSHAFHSHMMEPAVAPFRAAVAALELRAPRIPILSTVTGDWMTETEATDPDYWAMHMRRPVRFHDALQVMWAEGRHMFLESGPGRTLSTLAGQNPDRGRAQPALASLPHAQAEDADSHRTMLETFGGLWAAGWPVDWSRIDEGRPEAPRMRGLPSYPFQRKRHWVEPVDVSAATAAAVIAEAGADDAVTAEAAPAAAPADAGTAVREMLSDLSGIDPADMDGGATFLELGFDSLLLTQATREITDRFGVTVTLRQLIDGFPNIDALSAHIEANGTLAATQPSDKTPVAEMTRIEKPEDDESAAASPSSAPMTKIAKEADQLSPAQQAHIDKLVARFNAKTAKSKELTAKYRPVHADPRTASGFNRLWKELVYQIVSAKSKGSRLIDIDGNEYIDLLNGFGPGFIGHTNDVVTKAIAEQMAQGFEVGPQHLVAMEASQLFCDLTGNERASFVVTGSEAVYAAMRLARTVTSRDKVVMFQRDYHGNFDEVLVRGIDGKDGPRTLPLAPGVPRDSVKNVVVLPYGTAQSLDWIRKNADSVAAVIVEPVQSRRPEFRPAEFIRSVRQITERAGALFIFDEVVTGFRFGPRGAQDYYGVEADLVTYGKVVGGEMPVGVVSGKAHYMDTFDGGQWQYGDDSFPEAPVTFFAGTFVRHPLAMAAMRAMLQYLKSQPLLFWKTINAKGDRLAGTMDRWFEENDMPFQLPNCGSLMYLRIGEDQKFGGLYGAGLRDRGVFLLEGFPSYLTAAHDDEDIDYAIDAMKDAALEMRGAGLLVGREAVAYDRTPLTAPPPRLSLPDGEARIAAQMARPIGKLRVPTTEAQQEIWTAISITPELETGYNEGYTVSLRGKGIDIEALIQAVRDAHSRHDALSASFTPDGLAMMIGTEAPDIREVDVSGPDPDARIAAVIAAETAEPFDLTRGPLIRYRILVSGPEAVDLVFTAHHIVFDGWSGGTLLRDICRHYNAIVGDEPARVPPAQSPYHYSRAEAEWFESDNGTAGKDYWTETFADLPDPVGMPTDRPRAIERDVTAGRMDFEIPAETVARLRKAAAKMGVTLFSLMFATYKLYIARRSGASDLSVAIAAAGQQAYDMDDLVFHCVNLLPVRSRLDRGSSIRDYVKAVGTRVLEAREHQKMTYGAIVRHLNIPRDLSRTPLTTMLFNLDPALGADELDFAGVQARYYSNPRLSDNFEIFLNLTDRRDTIDAEWTYQSALFDEASIEGFMDGYVEVLERAVAAPDMPIEDVLSASPSEIADLAPVMHGPVVEIPPVCLHDLVTAQAAKTPAAIAVEAADEALDFAALDALSNRIANSLVARGVVPGDLVGVSLDRRPRTIATFLGVLKAGAAYVPLDPDFPPDRLNYYVDTAEARVIVVEAGSRAIFAGRSEPLLDLDVDALSADETAPAVRLDPESLAYVLFTSGSTGKPKGVAIPHRAFVNFVGTMAEAPGLKAGERVLAVTTFSFDMAGLELWLPLTTGATMVLATRDDARRAERLMALIDKCAGIDVIEATPATYRMLIEGGWKGRKSARVLIGGEAVPQDLADALDERVGAVWNMYGPTETTVWSTRRRLDGGRVSAGLPIANTDLVIVDETLRPVPPGVQGELLIGGAGMAKGYFNRPDLTAEKFITLPAMDDAPYYRTGDMARFIRDEEGAWTLEILGRADGQIKLRGFRIETGEIESALRAQPGIVQSAAFLKDEGKPSVHLVAVVTLEPGTKADPAGWRSGLESMLPRYMVPNRIVPVDKLPLTPNGKLDRLALARMDLGEPEQTVRDLRPANATEAKLAAMWSKLFDGREIAMDDNFFELGGHSLLAVKLFDRVRDEMGRDLPISTLFRHQTVRDLAAELAPAGDAGGAEPIVLTRKAPVVTVGLDGEWDSTTVIHPGPGGDRPLKPIFIVGGVGGNVNNLYEMGRELGRFRQVIGFQTRGIMGHKPHQSIEEMAADNIRYMRQYQAHGPYQIAGYSGGAYTALEIARQLEALGEEVSRLVIIDTDAPGFEQRFAPHFSASIGSRVKGELLVLRDEGLTTLFQRAKARFRSAFLRGPILELTKRISLSSYRFRIMQDAWWAAAEKYRGGPIMAPITMFATEPVTPWERAATAYDEALGWREFTTSGEFLRHVVPGTHLDMINGPRVKSFAAEFLAALEEPRSEAAE
ncbi:amino acid adenylation domain-containing protein [Rhodobacterales bacterium HKCCE2091]|nr:amino acid adenylation domain-containing protein [Rhodobacterales bacterium HKCCE2091]